RRRGDEDVARLNAREVGGSRDDAGDPLGRPGRRAGPVQRTASGPVEPLDDGVALALLGRLAEVRLHSLDTPALELGPTSGAQGGEVEWLDQRRSQLGALDQPHVVDRVEQSLSDQAASEAAERIARGEEPGVVD